MSTPQATKNNTHEIESVTNTDSLDANTQEVEAHSDEIIHESTIFAEPIGKIGGLTVTNALFTSWIAVGIIVLLAISLKRSLSKTPKGIQSVFEFLINGALGLCDQVTNDRALSKKVFPIVISLFFFILINNWLGIIPGVGSIGQVVNHDGHKVFIPYIRGGTADINTTLALSIFAVLASNVFGALIIGTWKTFNKYINIKAIASIPSKVLKDPAVLVVAPITFFVGVVEIVGEVAKIASLSFRLFGNVFAGEVLLASMAALMSFGVPIPFMFLEILVGFIQALIFSMLTLVYFTIASQDHDEHEEHEEKHGNLEVVHE